MEYNFKKVERRRMQGSFLRFAGNVLYLSKEVFERLPKTFDLYVDRDSNAVKIVRNNYGVYKKPKTSYISVVGIGMPEGRYWESKGGVFVKEDE